MPMNTEIKARWTAALRSGEYPQAEGRLRATEGFCCLGVLCDLAVKDGIIAEKAPSLDSYGGGWDYGETANNLDLPQAVMDWAGLGQPNPDVNRDSLPAGAFTGDPSDQPKSGPNLALLNDSGTPFDVIADIIDQQL